MLWPRDEGRADYLRGHSDIGIEKYPEIFYAWYDIFIDCSWVVTRWQYTFAQKQHIEQHKSQPNNTNNN